MNNNAGTSIFNPADTYKFAQKKARLVQLLVASALFQPSSGKISMG